MMNGDNLVIPTHDAWNSLRDAANRREVTGPGLDYTPRLQDSPLRFSGMLYVKGRAIDLTASTSKPWVRVMLDTVTAEYNDGPPTIPFPPFEVWYRTAHTYGDIVIP